MEYPQKLFGRINRFFWRTSPFGFSGDSFDILQSATLFAALDTASYYTEHLSGATAFTDDLALLRHALEEAPMDGLILEFGVASGRTINFISSLTDRHVEGFDAFTGLPESWRPGFAKGAFAQQFPKVRENVNLHVGLFSETLPAFLQKSSDWIALLHVDCDLYSSTKCIFDLLGDRIAPGTVIVFDEYWNYAGWRQHEWKAFQEYVTASGHRYEYIGFVPKHQQVAVKIIG